MRVRWPVGFAFFLFFLCLMAAPSLAQEAEEAMYPLPEDVSTLDGIIDAYYEVVSGPAGESRQTERDKSLHHPDARAIITGKNAEGTPFIRNMTLDEYHGLSNGENNPAFYEEEIYRITQTFGNVTHVWSTYAYRATEDGPIRGRGINSIHLFHDGERYWITAWIFDSERADNPIPPEFLPPEEH